MANFNPSRYRLKDVAFPVGFASIRKEAPVVIVFAILSIGSGLMIPWILLSSRGADLYISGRSSNNNSFLEL